MWNFFFNSDKILSRNRYPWIDYARGICIILVSFRHFFSGLVNGDIDVSQYSYLAYLNIFFFSFRMPLFFIVSGIFLRYSLQSKGPGNFITNRIQTVLYPLIIWGVLHISLQLIFADYVHANRVPSDYLRLLYQPRSVEQFWYLNALFFVSISYAAVTHFAKFNPIKQLMLGLMLYAVAAYFHGNEIETGFLTDVFFFYLFFAVGDVLADFMIKPENFNKIASFKSLFIILPVFLVLQHFFTTWNLESSNDYYVQNYRPAFFALAALVGGAFVLCVSFLLQKYNSARFLRVIGYHSLYIYVANLMVTATCRIVLVKMFKITNIPVLMIIGTTAGVVIPIMFYNLCQRGGAWWLYSLKKPIGKKSGTDLRVVNELPLGNKLKAITPEKENK